MLPIRTRSVFKSRWMALLWSGGIVWSALEFVGGQPAAAPKGNVAANSAAPADASDNGQPSAAQVAAAKAAIAQFDSIK